MHFSQAASRSSRSVSRRRNRRRSARRCASRARLRVQRTSRTTHRPARSSSGIFRRCAFRGSVRARASSPATTSRCSTDRAPGAKQFPVPVYRRPSNLFVRGVRPENASLPNKGEVFRKIGRRKLVPYYDRAQIEDGILSGRGIELCYVRNFTELLFMQIQGSARIKLEDGSTVRLNYDAHNGQAYTPVGRILIERNIVSREDMSMQRIRDYMASNPDAAKDLRRAEQVLHLLPRGPAVRQGRGGWRAGHSADGRPLDRGRSLPACLRHAVLRRGQPADRIGAGADAVSPLDGVPGHRARRSSGPRAPTSISAPASMPAASRDG